MSMLYHYTDRDSAAEIVRDGVIRARPVIVMDSLIGGREIELAPAVWFTVEESCPTVLAKLQVGGWPIDKPGMVWRICVADEVAPDDLAAWAHPHEYDPQLFRWMLTTAQLAGEDWQTWRLCGEDVPKEQWAAVQSLRGGDDDKAKKRIAAEIKRRQDLKRMYAERRVSIGPDGRLAGPVTSATVNYAEFDESEHPRGKAGEFVKKTAGGGQFTGPGADGKLPEPSKADTKASGGKPAVKKSKLHKSLVPDPAAAKEFSESGDASGFRIQDGKYPLPKKSKSTWADDEEETMPGVSGYANFINAIDDLLFDQSESVTGDNYSSQVKMPTITVLFGRSIDGPGAEIITQNPRIAAVFSKDEIEAAYRVVLKRSIENDPETKHQAGAADSDPIEKLKEEWRLSYDEKDEIVDELMERFRAGNAGQGAAPA